MKKIILTRGIQGSGKSTWAKNWVLEDPEHRVRFNNDDVRNMLGKYWVPSREHLVTDLKLAFLESAMLNEYNIVLDNMNLNDKEVESIADVIENHNSFEGNVEYKLEFKDFFIPVDECIKRDAARPNPIGEKVIKETWRRYRDKIIKIEDDKLLSSRVDMNSNLQDCIICDLDATLAFRGNNRPFWGKDCAEGIKDDIVDVHMFEVLSKLEDTTKIIFVTGREDANGIREATVEWLNKYFDPEKYELFMRPAKDYSPGPESKKKIYLENIYGKYNVICVFDDNYKCVKMYRGLGLLVLQPNEGKF